MPRQEVEFDFPDPDKAGTVEVEIPESKASKNGDIEIEGAKNTFPLEKPAAKEAKEAEKPKVIKKGDVEIEIVDDRPPEDRGVQRAKKPDPVTDDELAAYDDKVKERLKQLQRGYDDERRAKETARRQREELERLSKHLLEENQKLKTEGDRSYNVMITQAQQQVNSELEAAKRQYKTAYEAGDSDALLAAQEALTQAKIRADKVSALKPKPLQNTEKPVQPTETNTQTAPPRPVSDPKADSWRAKNEWFGQDEELTAFALGYHNKLVNQGIDPRSDEYYEKIDSRMREVFPTAFNDVDQQPSESTAPTPAKKPPSAVVAPASRSTAPKKVTLTHSQVSLCKRLGISLAEYAQHAAQLQSRK